MSVLTMYAKKFFLAKNYHSMRRAFYRGLCFNFVILLFSLVFWVRLDLLLESINFDPKASKIAWYFTISLIPGLVVRCYTESMKSYLLSMGFDRSFNV